MTKETLLLKNTLIYAIGNFASKLLGFILLPLYTSYLNTKDFGYFDLILSTVGLFLPIVTFQIYDGLYRYLLDTKNKEQKEAIIFNSFLVISKNLVISNLIYIFVSLFIPIQHSILILLYFDFLILSGLYTQIARGLKKNVVYTKAGVINTFISLISSLICVAVIHLQLKGLIISLITSNLITILYIEYKIKVFIPFNFSRKDKLITQEIIKYSIPLIPNVINWWVMNVSDRYIIGNFLGVDANGLYAVANKFPSILMVVNSVFYLAWQESAISEYDSNDKDFFYTKMFNAYMDIQFSALFILMSITKPLLINIVGNDFKDAWIYVPFLYFAVIFSAFSSFYGTGFQSSKETKGAFFSSIMGSLVNIIINIIIIPLIGIQGAALSTMCSFGVMWILRIYQTRKYFYVKINKIKIITYLLISILYLYLYFIGNTTNIFLMVSFSVIISLIINKKTLFTIFNYGKRLLYNNS